MFGIPWFGMVAIVAIVGGLFYAYKEQELKVEAKRMTGSKEIHELRKIIQSLKSRIEKLESSASSQASNAKKSVPLDDIEIKDEYDSDENDDSTRSRV
tara:strand:+ start:6771 stop:7064 length:294 start_codon:yes stop_codon:yes gene_type:complete